MRTVRASMLGALLLLLLASCRADPDPWADLPRPEHVGERVVIATDAADRVCAGTLATIDAEVERIELELELDASADPYRMWILDPARVSSICGAGVSSCTNVDYGAVVTADNFEVERRTARQLTPLLLARAGIEAHPYFAAGLAVAMSWPTCPPGWLDLTKLLDYIDHVHGIPDASALAGELVRWLLWEYGAAVVLEFLRVLPPDARSLEVQWTYAGYFGGSIEDDTADHMTSGPTDGHCNAPEPEPAGSRRLRLEASLDCDSPRVQTDFDTPGFGFVEWTLRPDRSGPHQLQGELPEGSRLEISRCMCDGYWQPFEPFSPDGENLDGYSYQLRWHGPLDAGLELAVELETPCSVIAQDCPEGSKCLSSTSPCQPLVDEPVAIGEPCSVGDSEPDPCVAGARCFGELDANGIVTGRCAQSCFNEDHCDAGDQCAPFFNVCGPACNDPITNDCGGSDIACTPSSDALTCLPAGTGTSFEPCEELCAPGFVCRGGFNIPCEDKCCVPLCDPALDGSDCLAEIPACNPRYGPDHATFGYCELEDW